jgi:hypothetical protein
MSIIFIDNKHYQFHYEIIESIIVKYTEIFNIETNSNNRIFLNMNSNIDFVNYIQLKYPTIILDIPESYDYYIRTTIYDYHYDELIKNSPNIFYISHEITSRLKELNNVFFLTPLSNKNYISADILPFRNNKVSTNIPIYIVQGSFNNKRRNIDLLQIILNETYEYKFMIKIIGKIEFLNELEKYSDKIIFKNNLSFLDFHNEFLDGYCILPLILKKTNPNYYTKKLTSTINYAKNYKLKCLIDKDLQDIYQLEDVEVFKDETDIIEAFKKTLKVFYT